MVDSLCYVSAINATPPTVEASGADDDDSSNDCMVLPDDSVSSGSVSASYTRRFRPTTAAWRKQKCAEFKLKPPNELPQEEGPVNIDGDGNCFFRTISYAVSGRQQHHAKFRKLVCDFISNEDDANFIRNEMLNGENGSQYVCRTKMRRSRTWATSTEIFAAAHVLMTPISSLLIVDSSQVPIFQTTIPYGFGKQTFDYGIYIDNSSGNHFDYLNYIN